MRWVTGVLRGERPRHPRLSNVSLFLARINGCLELLVIPPTLTKLKETSIIIMSPVFACPMWFGEVFLRFLHSDLTLFLLEQRHNQPEIPL